MKSIYIIGSLRNQEAITKIANRLEAAGFEAFDSWRSPGPEADDFWNKYEKSRGRTYIEALDGYAARHVFEFDKSHLDRCDAVVMVYPAGKSCHLELGYMIGKGKPGYVLIDQEPERWDIMLCFATGVFDNLDKLIETLRRDMV